MSDIFTRIAGTRGSARLPLWRFARDGHASALVEFALMLPVLLSFLAVCVVAGESLAISQKVTSTARTIVDIVSRNNQLSTSQMTAILDAAAYTMAPYSDSNLSMVVAEIQTNSAGAATVTWSAAAYGGTPLTVGASFTLPALMAVANSTYIYGQVTYAYQPLSTGYLPSQSIPLTDSAFFSPRVSTTVSYPYPN